MRPEKVASCMYRQFTTDFAKKKKQFNNWSKLLQFRNFLTYI
jgi:hypothetical protein